MKNVFYFKQVLTLILTGFFIVGSVSVWGQSMTLMVLDDNGGGCFNQTPSDCIPVYDNFVYVTIENPYPYSVKILDMDSEHIRNNVDFPSNVFVGSNLIDSDETLSSDTGDESNDIIGPYQSVGYILSFSDTWMDSYGQMSAGTSIMISLNVTYRRADFDKGRLRNSICRGIVYHSCNGQFNHSFSNGSRLSDEESSNIFDIAVYPNPVSNNMFVSVPLELEIKYKLYDIRGSVVDVLPEKTEKEDSIELFYDLSEIKEGIYYFVSVIGDEVRYEKIIKL